MTASLSRRGLAILLSVAILVALTALLPTMYAWWVGPWRQGVTLYVRLAGRVYGSVVRTVSAHGASGGGGSYVVTYSSWVG